MRKAGVLMPVSALPSRIGAGELGESAFQFIVKYRQRLGEVLQSVQSIGFKSKVSMSPNVRNGPFQRIYNLRISHAFISHFS